MNVKDLEFNLKNDEKILHQEKRKYVIIIYEKIFLLGLLICSFFIILSLYILVLLINRLMLEGQISIMMGFFIFTFGFFFISSLILLEGMFKKLKRIYRREKLRDLTYYENHYILTIKRWIEKSQEFFDFDYKKYLDYSVYKQEDIIYIDLNRIYAIHHISKKSSFSIVFQFNPEQEDLWIGSTIPFKQSLEIMNKLESLLDYVDKEEQKGKTSYFFRKSVD